jgi:hypothetical protein
VDTIEKGIEVPLLEVDKTLEDLRVRINNFTIQAPLMYNEFTDQWQTLLDVDAQNFFNDLLVDDILDPINDASQTVTDAINNVLENMGANNVGIKVFNIPKLDIDVDFDWVPRIPPLDVNSMLIPEGVLSVRDAIFPW